jgi:hypothetical protein
MMDIFNSIETRDKSVANVFKSAMIEVEDRLQTLDDLCAYRDTARNSIKSLVRALEDLTNQLVIGTYFDEHGHNAHNMKALDDALAVLKKVKP